MERRKPVCLFLATFPCRLDDGVIGEEEWLGFCFSQLQQKIGSQDVRQGRFFSLLANGTTDALVSTGAAVYRYRPRRDRCGAAALVPIDDASCLWQNANESAFYRRLAHFPLALSINCGYNNVYQCNVADGGGKPRVG
ncbi:hypothetical protein GT50_12005 [Geobacillus stearothermophilus 10]|nr:hypothetical protein GT50_12005 [Geobacillus stearothermophilus 10]